MPDDIIFVSINTLLVMRGARLPGMIDSSRNRETKTVPINNKTALCSFNRSLLVNVLNLNETIGHFFQ